MFCYEMLNQEPFARAAFDELVLAVAMLDERVAEIDWIAKSYSFPLFHNIQLVGLPESTPEENCQFQCRGYAVAAAFACSRVPIPAIQFLCCACIFGLEEVCSRCCKGKGFWENCVKSLRRLYHDPEHPENPAPHPYE